MKKRLWILAMILAVLGLAGCQNTTQADAPGNVITEQPDIQPTKEPEITAIPEPTKEPKPTSTTTPKPTTMPEATKEPEPTATPKPEVEPTNTPEPVATVTPEPTNTPVPTSTPKPTATPRPTATPKPMIEDSTAVVVFLPDDSNYVWEDAWFESETNVGIACSEKGLPEKGKVSLKLCYPNSVKMSERKDEFEFMVNGEGRGLSFDEVVEEGTMGDDWKYYKFEIDYETDRKGLSFLLKTHSKEGSVRTDFAVADLVVTDEITGKSRKIDLLSENVGIIYKHINFLKGIEEEHDYVLYKIDGKNIVEYDWKKLQGIEGNDWYNLTYLLPETESGWGDAWYDSEVNIICRYSSDTKLSQGTVKLTLCIPKISGANRTDVFELAVHAMDDFYNWNGETIQIEYKGEEIKAYHPERGEQTVRDCGAYYEINTAVNYDSSMVQDGTELQIILKSHCFEEMGAYEVTLSNMEVCDNIAGTRMIDFSADNVIVKGRMYLTNQPVKYKLSKNALDFYIKNRIEKMPIGSSFQLEVYASDNAELAFESSDTSILTVDAAGKVTSHREGDCTITVTNKKSGEQKNITIAVSKSHIIALEYEILMISGREGQLHFMTDYATKEGVYRYTSSDTSVATVDENGTVKAKKDGITTITVTDTANEATLSYELEVYTPEDKDGIGQYISMEKTGYVTADIARRSYQLIYDVYKNVFDYFNYGEYENVTLFFTVNDYSPAYSDCVDVYLASEHMLANAKDVDCITHELIHCAQDYISVWENDVWLMEGLTDYGRYLFGLHNEDCGWTLPEYDAFQHYTNSYGVTAAFIKFVTDNYCADMPHIINKMFKGPDGYDDSIWKTNTGYTIDELWELYAKS